jgi:predicted permease
MLLLVGAEAVLLLIACGNVSHLVLARGSDRRGELAVRAALGAGRGALVRLLLMESVVLAGAGGAIGTLLAFWAVAIVRPLVPPELALLKPVAIDGRVLLFSFGVSAIALLLCGLPPARRAAATDVAAELNRSSSRATAGRLGMRQLIIASEVALALVLLVGAGLTVNAMIRLVRVDHGYDTERVLTLRVQLPRGREYPKRSIAFVDRVLTAVRGVPGVLSAGSIEGAPLARTLYAGHYSVEGFSREWERDNADFGGGACCTQTQWVSAGYLAAMGVPVVEGRGFTPADATGPARVALINERLARKFPPGTSPIGHRLTSGDEDGDKRVIVGIVRDVRDMTLEYRPAQTIYLPLDERGASAMTVVLRTGVDPLSAAPAVRQAIQQHAGPVLVSDVQTLEQLLWRSVAPRRLSAWLLGSFGVVALLLSGIGIYGVVAYGVAQRTREIGVRLALGDSPAGVRRLILAQSLVPVGLGGVVGLVAASGLSRFLTALLYEVHPRDVVTYAAVSAVLCAAAVAAASVPAARASKVDPMVALRAE